MRANCMHQGCVCVCVCVCVYMRMHVCFRRVGYILNVAREIDNFFPGTLSYHNVLVHDEESTDLLAHWNDTYSFIAKAK